MKRLCFFNLEFLLHSAKVYGSCRSCLSKKKCQINQDYFVFQQSEIDLLFRVEKSTLSGNGSCMFKADKLYEYFHHSRFR